MNPSINKTIIFVVFLCATVMSSLFIYHMTHKEQRIKIAAEEGFIFPVPREIKPFELITANKQKLTQKNLLHHWTLLFFGFTHCSTICPTTLDLLNRVYSQMHPAHPDLQVLFISLDPERDSAEGIYNYTKRFNINFLSATGKIDVIRKLQSQLGIFASRDNNDSTQYQLLHTPSILLINPEGKWAGLFKNDISPQRFSAALESAVQQLRQKENHVA